METQLHLPRWERREPDWVAAGVAGFAAGAVLMVIELAYVAMFAAEAPWRISQMVAALTMGPDYSMQSPANVFRIGVVAIALVTHYALGIGFGLVLGFFIAGFHLETSMRTMLVIGAMFGLVQYLFNFFVVTSAFPWFVELRGWGTLVAHMIFGVVAAWLYWKLARRPVDRSTSS